MDADSCHRDTKEIPIRYAGNGSPLRMAMTSFVVD